MSAKRAFKMEHLKSKRLKSDVKSKTSMAEEKDTSKSSARRSRRVQASWNNRPSTNFGGSFRRAGSTQGEEPLVQGVQFIASIRGDVQTPTSQTNEGDDDANWVPPTSLHGMSVVDVHENNLKLLNYVDLADWVKHPNHVYIGRDMTRYVPGAVGSKWGNPFKSRKQGRKFCCDSYKDYVRSDQTLHNGKTLRQSLEELKGKTLGCWCHPKRCHGHMLVELVNELC